MPENQNGGGEKVVSIASRSVERSNAIDVREMARVAALVFKARGWTWGGLAGEGHIPDENEIASEIEKRLAELRKGDVRKWGLIRCGRFVYQRSYDQRYQQPVYQVMLELGEEGE